MINAALLLVSLLVCSILNAQVSDDYQPEEVFKNLKVKTRTQHFGSSTQSVIRSYFDENGRLSQWELTDNKTGVIPQATIKYYYNHRGLIIKAVEIFGVDSIIKTYYNNRSFYNDNYDC